MTEPFGQEFSVFGRDGDTLPMTHYGNASNQPHLRLNRPVRNGVFDFTMISITGLDDPAGGHVREILYTIVNAGRVTLRIIWTGRGAGAPVVYTLIRNAVP